MAPAAVLRSLYSRPDVEIGSVGAIECIGDKIDRVLEKSAKFKRSCVTSVEATRAGRSGQRERIRVTFVEDAPDNLGSTISIKINYEYRFGSTYPDRKQIVESVIKKYGEPLFTVVTRPRYTNEGRYWGTPQRGAAGRVDTKRAYLYFKLTANNFSILLDDPVTRREKNVAAYEVIRSKTPSTLEPKF